MKMQTNKMKVLLQSAMVLSVLGFCSIAQAIVVELRVNPTQDELTVDTHGTCTNEPNNNGCVHVSGKQQINFNLVGIKTCDEAPGAKWMLESVVLSESKGAAAGISTKASGDFGADEATGVVTEPVSQNPNHIGIRDNNTGEYDIWYTVKARCAGGTRWISIDPRIQNDGSGSN